MLQSFYILESQVFVTAQARTELCPSFLFAHLTAATATARLHATNSMNQNDIAAGLAVMMRLPESSS
jgi:hypothetical protein